MEPDLLPNLNEILYTYVPKNKHANGKWWRKYFKYQGRTFHHKDYHNCNFFNVQISYIIQVQRLLNSTLQSKADTENTG